MTADSIESSYRVLLAGDCKPALETTRTLLLNAGINPVFVLTDSRATLPFLSQHDVSVIILDLTASTDSAELLGRICMDYPNIRIIAETASGNVETAVKCMKSGAFDYIVRPVDPARLIMAVESALNSNYSMKQVASLKEYLLNDRLEHAEAFVEIKTASRKMRSIFQYTEVVSRSTQPVLITGETGVGKELFAHAIHRISKVRGSFVSVNVAGLDDTMFSDTLFGHKKGAFTGADQFRDGLVSKAAMGTLFLDEIGDLNESSQVKLLRLLQEREYYPVGSDIIKNSSARIVLATNVNLQERLKEGRFRRDLFYRLNTHQIHVPALRERPEDIPHLFATFVEEFARHFGRTIPIVSSEIIQAIVGYDFPGNVRELQAIVRDALVRHEDGMLSFDDFPGISATPLQHNPDSHEATDSDLSGIYGLFGRLPTLREVEDYLIIEALKLSEGNYAVAAAMLGVTRQTISNRYKSIKTES